MSICLLQITIRIVCTPGIPVFNNLARFMNEATERAQGYSRKLTHYQQTTCQNAFDGENPVLGENGTGEVDFDG